MVRSLAPTTAGGKRQVVADIAKLAGPAAGRAGHDFAVGEYNDDLAVARLAWLARDDQAALDQACDVCLSYTNIDLGIRARAIGLARVRFPDLPPDPAQGEA
jgi:hypothetical protein